MPVKIGRVGTRPVPYSLERTHDIRFGCDLPGYVPAVDVPAFEADPTSTRYLYEQVADHVEARIKAGDLPPGARLPRETEFADEYGVSLRTGRRAVRELRERGLVYTVPIKGTFVTKR